MDQLSINQDQIDAFCKENAISYMALFGSFARGEANPKSDVDVVVKFSKNDISLLDHIAVEDAFSRLVGRPVDMLTERSLSPLFKQTIISDLKPIYEN